MTRITLRLLALSLPLLAACPVWAQTTIDQAKALAGGITAGDAPGFPVTLSATGSYKLTSNLIVPGNVSGIAITAPNVTLDLNGYSIIGPVNCTATAGQVVCTGPIGSASIGISAVVDGLSLRNGHVRGFGDSGIQMRGGLAEDLQVESNHGDGFSAAALPTDLPARISGVRVRLNAGVGLRSRHAIIERVVSSANQIGIWGYDISIIDSRVVGNFSKGLQDVSSGVVGAQPSALKGTVMHSNGSPSISGVSSSLGGNLIDGVAY